MIEAINPATGERIAAHAEMTPAQVRDLVVCASAAQKAWRRLPLGERADCMRRVAATLRRDAAVHAELMALEMGKVRREGEAEIDKCARVCDFYAANAARFLADEPIPTDASRSFVTCEPLGVLLAVMPWNFPFWQVFRCAVPALMAGNTVLLKHAPNVPGCALSIERVFRESGCPAHVVTTLLVEHTQVESILAQTEVRAVALTGSTRAGRAVAGAAGRLLKKAVLELGGSDAYIVLHDADLDETVSVCVNSRLINAGQSCVAAKRFVVVDTVRRDFESRLVERMRLKRYGDPRDDLSDYGPLARLDLRHTLHTQTRRSIAQGARCLLGGEQPAGQGAYYPPTVLGDVGPGMPAYDEELFGPVASILPARDEDDAIRIANDTSFGLGAAVFTRDLQRGEQIAARRLDAGSCFVNTFVRSDPRLPFGGIKDSGYGRELAHHGIKEFVNIKTVYIR